MLLSNPLLSIRQIRRAAILTAVGVALALVVPAPCSGQSIPQPPIQIPQPPIHIPHTPIHIPQPPIHIPQPQIYVPQPPIHVPQNHQNTMRHMDHVRNMQHHAYQVRQQFSDMAARRYESQIPTRVHVPSPGYAPSYRDSAYSSGWKDSCSFSAFTAGFLELGTPEERVQWRAQQRAQVRKWRLAMRRGWW